MSVCESDRYRKIETHTHKKCLAFWYSVNMDRQADVYEDLQADKITDKKMDELIGRKDGRKEDGRDLRMYTRMDEWLDR